MRKFILGVVLGLAMTLAARADSDAAKPLELHFVSTAKKQIDLKNYRGKVVLIDFWATWCPPCRAEVPNVVAAYTKYHGKGFEILGISLDQDKDALEKFTRDYGMVWPQYFDGEGWDNAVSSRLGIDSIPAMWLVGKNGILITQDAGDDLAAQVEKALKAP